MSEKINYIIVVLEAISKSNNFQLANQFANIPLHLDQLVKLKKEIVKKDQRWKNSVFESLRLFSISTYLGQTIPVKSDVEKEVKLLVNNAKVEHTEYDLNRILLLIWKMYGHKIYNTQLNADRALKQEQSKAQRNEAYTRRLKQQNNNHYEADLLEEEEFFKKVSTAQFQKPAWNGVSEPPMPNYLPPPPPKSSGTKVQFSNYAINTNNVLHKTKTAPMSSKENKQRQRESNMRNAEQLFDPSVGYVIEQNLTPPLRFATIHKGASRTLRKRKIQRKTRRHR